MALPYPFEDPHRGGRPESQQQAHEAGESDTFRPMTYGDNDSDVKPRVIRLRVAPWDLIATLTLVALLVVLATATTWPTRLYGFLGEVCSDDSCGLVPFQIDVYIYPVVWGGIGAAIAAAGIGPFVSLLKGWYMSFWPVLSLAIILMSSVIGDALTVFSARYWH
ncbi:putative membrane protein [Mycobacterium lentiflavum]|nr:putative membrane protein [Mycobacterium lentiflavum]